MEPEPTGPVKAKAAEKPTTGKRRGRPPGSGRGQKFEQRLAALQEKLSSEMFQAGALIGMPFNVTGYYICQESDNFTKALIQLASRRPEWVDALETIADLQPGIVVGRTAFGVGAAFAVDREKVDPEKPFLKFLGVYSAWKAVQNKGGMDGLAEGSSYQPPPSQFVPVS